MSTERTKYASLHAGLRILKALKGKTLDGLSNKELAQALGMDPTNVSRYCNVLVDEGLVQKLENGRFTHSVGMLQIAVAYADHIDRTESRIQELKQRVHAGAQQ